MTDKKKLHARVVNKDVKYKGFLSVSELTIERERHEGGMEEVKWLMMERGHAVAVLAYDPVQDLVVLVNEMRPGILVAGDYPYTDNLIAGGIGTKENPNETPLEAAVRETAEEAGLFLKDPKMIHDKSYVSTGGTSERISIVFGVVSAKTAAGGIHGATNESENIKVTVISSDEFMRQVKADVINDLKSMVAAYWLKENRAAIRKKYAPQNQRGPKKPAKKMDMKK